MLENINTGESRRKGFVVMMEEASIRKYTKRISLRLISMELFSHFNVKIVSVVKKIGKLMDDSSIAMYNDLVYINSNLIRRKGFNNINLFESGAVGRYERLNGNVVPAQGVVYKNDFVLFTTKSFFGKLLVDSVEDIIDSYNYSMSRIVRR